MIFPAGNIKIYLTLFIYIFYLGLNYFTIFSYYFYNALLCNYNVFNAYSMEWNHIIYATKSRSVDVLPIENIRGYIVQDSCFVCHRGAK